MKYIFLLAFTKGYFIAILIFLLACFFVSMFYCFKLMAKNEQLEEEERKRKYFNNEE